VETWSLVFRDGGERSIRYHYEKPEIYSSLYGSTYECDHPVYNRCTLFKIGNRGLAIIQQRRNKRSKATFWSEIEPWLTDALYLHTGFRDFFNSRAREPVDGLYPTVTIRQIMWALKLKPLPKKRWETCFDRKDI
jgi:hypothetical protein